MLTGKRPHDVLAQSLESATKRVYRKGYFRPEVIIVRKHFFDSLQPKHPEHNNVYQVPGTDKPIVLTTALFVGQLPAGTLILDGGYKRANIRSEVIRTVTEMEVKEGILVCE